MNIIDMRTKFWILLLSAILLSLLVLEARSQALMITPKRIVLTDKQKNDIVKLFNNSDDTMSYSVHWRHFRMLQNGTYEEIDSVKPEDMVADDLVRFFPPEVTLPPHSAQIVRLRFLRPKDLTPGEYRSHLAFVGLDRAKPAEWIVHDTISDRVQVQFRPVWGVSIPVIARLDTTPATVTIDSIGIGVMDTARNVLIGANLNRSGLQTFYGEIEVKYHYLDGRVTQLGLLKNVAVFPPLRTRKVVVSCAVPKDVSLTEGRITMEYQSGSGTLLQRTQAQVDITLTKKIN
jgi:hypothetical protein